MNMKQSRWQIWLQIIYLIVAVLTILEFLFVQGMFTWLLVVLATLVVGGLNVGVSVWKKDWMQAGFFFVLMIALCMGYWEVLGFL